MPSIPLIISGSGSQAGVARSVYRNRLAETLGYYATGTVTRVASGLEAERYVISSALRSNQAAAESLDGLYLYVLDGAQAGEQRRIVSSAYEGTIGAIMVDEEYDDPLALGARFEISVLPAEKYLGAEGLNHILNLALEELPLVDFSTITMVATVAGTIDTIYSMAGYTWPIKKVTDVYYYRTSTVSERRRVMPRGSWSFELDAETPVISFASAPANTGQTVEVQLHRPAHTRIRQSGTWLDTLDGLENETDEAVYDAATVVREARPIALQRMALLQERGSALWKSLKDEEAEERVTAALSRLQGRFKGSGAQRIGATGGR